MRVTLPVVAAFTLALSAGLAQAAPTYPTLSAQESPTEVTEAVVEGRRQDPDDPVICRRVAPTGSRITKKTCMPKSQWVARSTRSPKISEVRRAEGLDDKLAPLPPAAEFREVDGAR